jgi:DNA-binding response OmpR family regulator
MMISRGILLIIEPDDDLRHDLEDYFSHQDFDVMSAASAEDALCVVKEVKPTVIVSEIDLGGHMNGWELARALLEDIRTSYLPIIFVTNRLQRLDRLAALRLGADDYLTKPIDLEELELRIDRTIRRL